VKRIEIIVTVNFRDSFVIVVATRFQLNDHRVKCLGIVPDIDICLCPKQTAAFDN